MKIDPTAEIAGIAALASNEQLLYDTLRKLHYTRGDIRTSGRAVGVIVAVFSHGVESTEVHTLGVLTEIAATGYGLYRRTGGLIASHQVIVPGIGAIPILGHE